MVEQLVEVRDAIAEDWLGIVRVQLVYERQFGDVPRSYHHCRWRVARHDARVVGAYSWGDDAKTGQRVIYDFYVAAGRWGVVAAYAMADDAIARADADRKQILAVVHPENGPFLRRLAERAFLPAGILVSRQPAGKGP